jgi:MFS transporter, PPP family, 3-phenylpropionic acid transporter
VLNSFQSLPWNQQGYTTTSISLLIGIGAFSETIAFFLYQRVENRLNVRLIILLSGVVTVFRWFAMAQEPAIVWLVLLQTLHGITFALGFLSCVNYIGRKIPVTAAAEAQSFFLVLQQLAAIAVISVFSSLATAQGSGAYFGNAVMALFGTALICWGLFFGRNKQS